MKNKILFTVILYYTLISEGTSFHLWLFNIYPNDIIATILLFELVYKKRMFKSITVKYYSIPLIIISLLLFGNFIIGYVLYKKTAFVHFREYYYTYSALLYFSTFKLNKKVIKDIIVIYKYYVVVIVVIFIAKVLNINFVNQLFPSFASQIYSDAYIKRYLNAEQVLFLSTVLLYILARSRYYLIKPSEKTFALLLMVIIVLAQVRSVWLSLILTLYFYYLFIKPNKITVIKPLVFGIVVFSTYELLFSFASKIINTLIISYNNIFAQTSTAAWRIESWKQLIYLPKGLSAFVGLPFGTSYGRTLFNGIFTDASPHNYYLHNFLVMGTIGIGNFIYLYIKLVKSNRNYLKMNVSNNIKQLNLFFVLILINYAAYFMSYDGTQIFGMLVGCSISFLKYENSRKITMAVNNK